MAEKSVTLFQFFTLTLRVLRSRRIGILHEERLAKVVSVFPYQKRCIFLAELELELGDEVLFFLNRLQKLLILDLHLVPLLIERLGCLGDYFGQLRLPL